MGHPKHVIDEVNRQIEVRRILDLIGHRMDKIQEKGETLKGFCPIHGESVFRTLIIDKAAKTFRCMYGLCEGSEGGDLIRLYSLAKRKPYDDCVAEIVRELKLKVELEVDPALIESKLHEADDLLDAGDAEGAHAALTDLLALNPVHRGARELLLRVAQLLGDAELEAEQHRSLAPLLVDEGQGAQALGHLKCLATLCPDDEETLVLLGRTARAENDPDAALDAYMSLADIRAAAGDFDGALEAYNDADALGLDVVDVNAHIIQTCLDQGQPQRAVALMIAKAEAAAGRSDMARAAELLEPVLDLAPENANLALRFADFACAARPISQTVPGRVLAIAAAARARGDGPLTLSLLQRLVIACPNLEPALEALGAAFHDFGMTADAADTFVDLAQTLAADGHIERAAEQAARVLVRHDNHIGALELLADLEAALSHVTEANKYRRRLASALLERAEYGRAAKVLSDILEADPGAFDAEERRAQVLEAWAGAGSRDAGIEAAAAYEKLADHYLDATSGRRAVGFLERSLALDSTRSDRLMKLARLYARTNSGSQACDAAVRACDLMAREGHLPEATLQAELFLELIAFEPDFARYLAQLYRQDAERETAVVKLRALALRFSETGQAGVEEEMLRHALELQPRDTACLEQLAELCARTGRTDEELQIQFRLADLSEQEGDLPTSRARLELILDRYPGSKAALERLISVHGALASPTDDKRWRLALADAYHRDTDYTSESATLAAALVRDPADEEVSLRLAKCESARGQHGESSRILCELAARQADAGRTTDARATLDAGLLQMPDDSGLNRALFDLHRAAGRRQEAVSIGLHLVDLLTASGDPERAAEGYDDLIQCDPENLTLRLNQVDFLRRIGRDAEAAKRLFELARHYRGQGHFAEAQGMLEDLLSLEPQNAAARQELIALLEEAGSTDLVEEQLHFLADDFEAQENWDELIGVLRRILGINPGSIASRRRLIDYYADHAMDDEAVRELHALADYHTECGSADESLAAEREAVGIAGSDPAARRRLADALLRAGETVEGVRELETLAARFAESGQHEEALTVLNQLLEAAPDRLTARRLRAEAYSALGDDTRALQEFRELARHIGEASSDGMPAVPAAPLAVSLQIVPEYDFERFVVGTHNNFAFATAQAVAKAPNRAYNPLFLYSDVGLGKTHLVNAIANFILKRDPRARVVYTNSEDFTGELINAIQNNTIGQFRSHYKSADLLIVDDVQFLAGKERAQEEFFHIFNALFQAKRQIVVTSDRPPKDIAHLESRLLSRFGAGVIVDIKSPDLETRIAILKRELERLEASLDSAVLMLLAERVDSNVRELKGALTQVLALRDLQQIEPTETSVRQMLDSLYAKPLAPPVGE